MLTLFHSLPHNKTFVGRRHQKKGQLSATLCSKQRGLSPKRHPSFPVVTGASGRKGGPVSKCADPKTAFQTIQEAHLDPRNSLCKLVAPKFWGELPQPPGLRVQAPPPNKIGSPKHSPNRRLLSRNISVSGFQCELVGYFPFIGWGVGPSLAPFRPPRRPKPPPPPEAFPELLQVQLPVVAQVQGPEGPLRRRHWAPLGHTKAHAKENNHRLAWSGFI